MCAMQICLNIAWFPRVGVSKNETKYRPSSKCVYFHCILLIACIALLGFQERWHLCDFVKHMQM